MDIDGTSLVWSLDTHILENKLLLFYFYQRFEATRFPDVNDKIQVFNELQPIKDKIRYASTGEYPNKEIQVFWLFHYSHALVVLVYLEHYKNVK